jgi:zinc D-Ala-D-Ala carboxypeptidase
MPYKPGNTTQGNSGRVEVADVYHSPDVFANWVEIALWQPPGEVIDGIFIPNDPYQPAFVQTILCEAGGNSPHDDPDSTVLAYPKPQCPGGQDEDNIVPIENPVTDDTPANKPEGTPIDCGSFKTNPIDYNQNLSPNFTIKNLTIGATFAHNIVAQNGLSVEEIICNLKGVCENILEPLKEKYPGFRINSGFRKGAGNSQHNKGMAVDLQWPGLSASGYTPIAQWIKNNLPFDQLIFEHGNSIWLHISYNRTAAKQRNALLTYYPKNSPQYKPGLTNYYA